MSEWLYGQPADYPYQGDPDELARMYRYHHVVTETFSRLAQTLDIAAWQRRAGCKRTMIWIFTVLADVPSPQVVGIENVVEADTDMFRCQIELPVRWLSDPIDGVWALRVKMAALQALDAIGDHFGFGPVPVRSTPTQRSDLDRADLFAPNEGPDYEAVATQVWGRVAGSVPGEAWVLGLADVSHRDAAAREALLGGLGNAVFDCTLTPSEGKALKAWKIRIEH